KPLPNSTKTPKIESPTGAKPSISSFPSLNPSCMIPLLMHYLIDAYNLLFRFSKKGNTLKKKRQQMIEEINAAAAHLPFSITLVFDGAEEHFTHSTREHFDAVELVYTPKNTSADDYISKEVIDSPSPTQITVVTNDRDLATRCRNHRANTLT